MVGDKDYYYKNNRLQKIRGFYHTVKQGGISAAARQLNLSQPAVSLQIQSLEKELAVKLFEREGNGVKLSKEGADFYALCVPVMEAVDMLFENFTEIKSRKEDKTLKIAGNNVTINYILPPALKCYLKEKSDAHVAVHHAPREEGLSKLAHGEVDIFVTPKPTQFTLPPHYEYVPFARFVPSLITLPDHPLAGKKHIMASELAAYDLSLSPPQFHIIPGLEHFLQDYGIDQRVRIEFFDWETTRRYVEQGITILIASNMVLAETDCLVATPLTHYFPLVDCGYILLRGHKIDDKVLTFIGILKGLFPGGLSTHGLTFPIAGM